MKADLGSPSLELEATDMLYHDRATEAGGPYDTFHIRQERMERDVAVFRKTDATFCASQNGLFRVASINKIKSIL